MCFAVTCNDHAQKSSNQKNKERLDGPVLNPHSFSFARNLRSGKWSSKQLMTAHHHRHQLARQLLSQVAGWPERRNWPDNWADPCDRCIKGIYSHHMSQ